MIAGILKKVRDASTGLGKSIGDVRARIGQLQDEKAAVEAMPPALETALARVDEWVAHLGIVAHHKLAATVTPERFAAATFSPPNVHSDEFGALWVLQMGPDLAQRLKEQVTAFYSDVQGVTDAEREKRLAEIDRQILDASLAEESLLRAAEAAGFSVSRRADADPLAVLAAYGDLP